MPLYKYIAINDFGKKMEGEAEGVDEKALGEKLSLAGLYLLEASEKRPGWFGRTSLSRSYSTAPASAPRPPVPFQPLPFVLGLVGLLFIVGGVFAPFVSVPVFGSISLFKDGAGDGVVILFFAFLGILFLLARFYLALCAVNGLSMILTGFEIGHYLLLKEGIRTKIPLNPFEKLGADLVYENVRLDWALGLLFVGYILVFVAVFLPKSAPKS